MQTLAKIVLSFIVVIGVSSSSKAQNAVPGGWSNQVRYQGVGAGYYLNSPSLGQNGWNNGGYSSGIVTGNYRQARTLQTRPQTYNNLGFLGETVRRTTRTRRSH